ncbi:ADP-ribosylglycohydrolase family protein [Aquabacterium sp. A7-Y]|uniref:ADP-ribosylglycohydrolase family protein n=1 Tax=Aquabacterium sp. A7-Y TaxID=1349605 RepID=UPI00223CE578|nr:ADP-ribosylglycohydrolase family protein [Aquabacterium sp. A7-Y]MCW7540973.1 ADP-ribosylglycohydrolase family protein [Aquabacterium sp. A7-Y]
MADRRQNSSFLESIEKERERRSSFPWDMGFFPLSDKFTENVQPKNPWLADYYSYRSLHHGAGSVDLRKYIEEKNGDGSILADRFRGALLGLMIGDALGVPLEFSPRDSKPPVSDIAGGGPFALQRGFWTDDTSMACCLMYSLLKSKGFDAAHQMQCYSYWYRFGAYSPTGKCFDIGATTRQAIEHYLASGNPMAGSTNPKAAGNGSLMRLAPVVLFYFGDFEKAVHYAGQSSMTTHGAVEAVDACRYFAALIHGALAGETKERLLDGIYSPIQGYWERHPLAPAIERIAMGSHKGKPRTAISSSGYVVHTLEAALWAFFRNPDFRSGALEAVNLADDSDTVGAVFGQLAGSFYGETQIPIEWILKTHATPGCYHFIDDLMPIRREIEEGIPRGN